MTIWMKVSADEYEWPLQIADTQKELAEKCGVRRDSITSAIRKSQRKGHKCCYVRVVVEEEEP